MTALYDRFIPATNGETSMPVAVNMVADPQYLAYHRPYLPTHGPNENIPCVTIQMNGKDGKPWTVNEKGEKQAIRRQVRVVDALMSGHPVPLWALNATTFRRDDWIQIQDEAEVAYRNRLSLISTLQSRVSVPGGGWGKLTYEYDAMSDAHSAVQDMDGITEAHNDAPLFLPRSVPQPFTHSDFYYSDRILAASRQGGRAGMDVYSSEMAGRRCGELMEDVAIGITTGVTWGTRANYFPHDLTSTQFGLANYTNRNIKTNFTLPTAGGWVPNTLYNEILVALNTLRADNVYGPFGVFYSVDFDSYMAQVFSISGGNTPGETLLSMLGKHPDIATVQRLDRLTSTFTLFIIALDRKYIVYVDGMGLRTWQWDSRGGMQKNYKVGLVGTTLLKSDYTGRAGYLHGTTA